MSKISGLFSSIEKKISHTATNVAEDVTSHVEGAAGRVVSTARAAEGDLFSGVEKAASNVARSVEQVTGGSSERDFVTGRGGFVAVDAQGKITGGQAAGVRVGDLDLPKSPLDSLLKMIDHGESRPVTFTLPSGKTITSKTDGSGHQQLPLSDLDGKALERGLDPKKGGLVHVGVSTPGGPSDQANVLVLPKSYDGPVFVCDIDDTLRATSYVDLAEGKTQAPIPGAKDLLDSIAAKGVPIIYLSAGPDKIHSQNEAFLKQLPPGVLLDRSNTNLSDLLPLNGYQAQKQGDYKAQVLSRLEQTYPHAKLFGMGDDKYGDADAYTEANATTYIHDVKPDHSNLPADFHGTLTKNYTPDFIAKVGNDLQTAISRSASFGGTPKTSDEMAAISKELDRVTGTKLTHGNVIQPYIDGQSAFPQVLSTIDSAKKSLTYSTYNYVAGDETSEEVTDHLIAAAKRGVQVHVLADAIGSRVFPLHHNPLLEKLKANGVDVRIYNPVDRISDLTDYHIDHRKTIVADGTTAWVGGMNTGDKWFGGPNVPGRMHDVFARISGPAVQQVAQDFADSWSGNGAGGSPLPAWIADPPASAPEKGGVDARVVAHTKDDSKIRATYLALIDNAKKTVDVENPFPASDDIVSAMCAAAERGVNVRYIVGAKQGMGLLNDLTEKNFSKLLAAGVHIYQYPTPIHTKSLSVDDMVACVGSSNVDNASLSRNREITAVVQDPAWVKQYDQEMFGADLVGSPDGKKTVELPKNFQPSAFARALDGLASLPFLKGYI